MPKSSGENARDKLVGVGTDLLRRNGYTATTVDEICSAAGLTKGAFFHHFPSKEALAAECLHQWPATMASLHRSAAYQSIDDPVEKVLASIDFIIEILKNPDVHKSCLAGTMVQEVSETNPVLRDAAQACFVQGQAYFQSLLDEACRRPQANPRHRLTCRILDEHDARLAASDKGLARSKRNRTKPHTFQKLPRGIIRRKTLTSEPIDTLLYLLTGLRKHGFQ